MPPATRTVVDRAVMLLRDAARRGDAGEDFVTRAAEILSFHAELTPDDVARARKAEVWAAAALHAAPFTMFPGYANPDRPTLEDAARCFGVSSQFVSIRSRPIR